jgi:xylulokinase
LLPDGGAEQDPDDWWTAIVTAAKRLIARQLVATDDISAICCTAQWSGTVAVDEQGRHLMNAIIWMDSRGANLTKQMVSGLINIEGYELFKIIRWLRMTGGAPAQSGKDPVGHILYLKDKHPEICRQTFKFLEPKDYLNLRLTGKFAASYDSIALHWCTDNRDLSRVRYDDKLISLIGIGRDKLPELKRAVDILGEIKPEVADQLGLSKNVQVVMGTPDVQSAAIGSGAVEDYAAHFYIGTSSWLTCHVPYKKTDLLHNMASLPSAIPNRYFVGNSQEIAGAAVDFLVNNILFCDDELETGAKPDNVHQILDKIASRVPAGSDKLIFTPWLYGERTPVEDATLRGGFFNQSLKTTREHYARAVLEGVAYNARWLLIYVEKFIKQRLKRIDIIGGGAQSDTWCQILADVLDRPVGQVANPIQANVRGAGLLGAVAMGYLSFKDIPGRVQIKNTYQPDPANREIYDELYDAFLQIYKRNKKIYARLNRTQ